MTRKGACSQKRLHVFATAVCSNSMMGNLLFPLTIALAIAQRFPKQQGSVQRSNSYPALRLPNVLSAPLKDARAEMSYSRISEQPAPRTTENYDLPSRSRSSIGGNNDSAGVTTPERRQSPAKSIAWGPEPANWRQSASPDKAAGCTRLFST